MAKALIVVDVQNDFIEGGSLAVTGGARVAEQIRELLDGKHGYDYVVATRDHHIDPGAHFADEPDYVDSWPRHCVADTAGAELHSSLLAITFDAVFDKGEYEAAYSGFEGKAAGITLLGWLDAHGVDTVDVCGIATDYCVRATALDAAKNELKTTVLLSLTAAVSPDNVEAVLAEFTEAGISTA
jgi:nicotinamidase/pyrazinamidase